MSRTATATACCLLTGVLALSACSQDGSRQSAPDVSVPDAGSSAAALPVLTTKAAPAPSAASSSPRTSPAKTAPRSTSTRKSTSTSTSTAKPTASPKSPDGKAFALLEYVGPDRVIRYDKVDFVPAACARRTEDQYADARATLRVCFSNVSSRLRTAKVTRGVDFGYYGEDGSWMPYDGLTYEDLRRDAADPSTQGDSALPVRLTIVGGVVTRIEQAALLAG